MKTYYQRKFYLPSTSINNYHLHHHHRQQHHDTNSNYLSSPSTSSNSNSSSSYWHRGSIQIKRWLGRSSTTAMTDGICSGFEPQNYLRDRCKKCFRLKSKHDETNNNNSSNQTTSSTTTTSATPLTNGRSRRPVSVASAIGQSPPPSISDSSQSTMPPTSGAVATAILAKKEKRKSWRDRNHQSPDEGPDNEVPDTSDTISQASFKSAYSKGMSSAKSLESITSINDTKSMITACSGDSFGNENDVDDDERALTPTESECTNDHLKSHLRRLKEENSKLKEEKQRLTSKHTPKDGNEMTLVQELQERLAEAENIIQDYRDENTVLKCELRDINAPIQNGNNNSGNNGEDYDYKLKETENLCEELMIENENLKSDIRDLQQEIEEMQDQYREEEIEEFRELQRELEQNAKNCRVLQFKLRKAERQRDSAETERDHVQMKLKEFSKGGDPSALDYIRQKELESELRIAKEVSVRLHNELEAAEEKRCKLEDEVFYYKEKCRELQTQHKWRETRNKADQAAKRHSQEIVEAVDLPTDELRKELRDVLERENDLREQLRFTEEDLKRSRSKLTEMENENEELLQKLMRLTETASGRTGQRRPPITRSASEGQTELQLELAATELDQLQTKCDNLEKKNLALTKKMLEMEIDLVKKLQDSKGENGNILNAELEKDLGRLMSTIHELEKKNSDLTQQLKRQSTTEFAGSLKIASAPNSPIIGKEKSLQVELRNEQEKRKELEIEIAEYKSLIAKSDNQKLIAMATKVELLQNQLLLANDRCNALHKKALKESVTDMAKYADSLKQRCEILEKQLSEEKSNKIYEKMKKMENHDASPTSDEIEHCCVVLASIEAQTNRLAKQVDKIDSNGQKDQRRRSLTLDSSAAIVGELANVLSELKGLKDILHNHKISNPNYIRESPDRDLSSTATTAKICESCEEKLKTIDSMKDEIGFYKKKNKELTNQVLQTEDRWSREIEKQTHGYRSQIHALDTNLGEVQKKLDEQIHLTESINAQLTEKKRTLDEEKERIIKLQSDLEEKQKTLQQVEKEQHILREWEIKYRKLEKLFDQEKSKFDADRLRIKSDTAVLKKRTDEAVADLEKLRNSHQRREIMWNEERQRLEKEMIDLREKIGNKKDSNNDDGVIIPVQTLNYKVARINGESVPELKAKLSAADKKIDALETKLIDLRISKEELESEALRKKISFEREKDTLLHKVRQDDKVKIVEIDALQQKFASRMSIMENTNKSLHSQLVQTRRERDHHREAVANYETRLEKEQQIISEQLKKINDSSQKASQAEKRVQELEAEIHRLTVELSFSKDAHKADKKLWKIEKNHYNKGSTITDNEDRRITEDALKAAESVQKQYAEYQKLYASEVDRLNKKVKEGQSEMAHKQFETEKIIRELREQIKMLEIDQKNLMQAKEMQTNAREVLQADQERLLQIVQQGEVQKLTRKYKIAAITDQLYGLPDKAKAENDGVVSSVISQLNAIREEDSSQNLFTSNDISDMDYTTTTQDLISQSSISIKSTPYQTSRLASRQTNPSSYSLGMPISKDRSYSIDSNSTWAYDISERSSRRPYPDPPPSFLPSKDRVPEYDKDGRLHYIPKSIARSTSYDRYGNSLSTDAPLPPTMSHSSTAQIQTRSTGTWTEDNAAEYDESMASRTGNAGTNILYKIRREELSKGTTPSVRSIAKAFESMDPRTLKRGLFSIRKSRSVDTSEQGRQSKHNVSGNNTLRPVTPLNRNTTSMSQIEIGDRPGFHNAPPIGPNLAHCTLPRNRNPFKNMGAKIVDRVRRSLSRSRRPSEEKLNIDSIENNSQMLPPIPVSSSPSSSYPSSSFNNTETINDNSKGKPSKKSPSSSDSKSNNNSKQTKKTTIVVKKKTSAVP